MRVKFGNHNIVNNTMVSKSVAQLPFEAEWNQSMGNLYTIMFYDTSAPSVNNPYNSPYMHFMEVNIGETNHSGIVVDYMPPTPPPNTGDHIYRIEVYLQSRRFNHLRTNNRNNFPVSQFVAQAGLTLVDTFHFMVDPPSDKSSRTQSSSDKSQWVQGVSVDQQKYCRCVAEVAGKQSDECLRNKQYGSGHCYNPYAVCGRIHHDSRECGPHYNFEALPDQELMGYAGLHKVPIPNPYNRQQMLNSIYASKKNE